MPKNYAYEVVCHEDHGWGECPEGLWSLDYVDRADRIFATAAEAHALAQQFRDAGCWEVEHDDGTTEDQTPDFGVETIAVYEACWEDDEDVRDRLIDIHGRAIEFRRMPKPIAAWLVEKYTGRAADWSRASASLVGASSATHTAAFISARMTHRAHEIAEMLRERGDLPAADRG